MAASNDGNLGLVAILGIKGTNSAGGIGVLVFSNQPSRGVMEELCRNLPAFMI
jgi:hypothetical protein